eukprot:gene31044-7137_t
MESPPKATVLMVTGLPPNVLDTDLKREFEIAGGTVIEARSVRSGPSFCLGIAFVTLADDNEGSARRASATVKKGNAIGCLVVEEGEDVMRMRDPNLTSRPSFSMPAAQLLNTVLTMNSGERVPPPYVDTTATVLQAQLPPAVVLQGQGSNATPAGLRISNGQNEMPSQSQGLGQGPATGVHRPAPQLSQNVGGGPPPRLSQNMGGGPAPQPSQNMGGGPAPQPSQNVVRGPGPGPGPGLLQQRGGGMGFPSTQAPPKNEAKCGGPADNRWLAGLTQMHDIPEQYPLSRKLFDQMYSGTMGVATNKTPLMIANEYCKARSKTIKVEDSSATPQGPFRCDITFSEMDGTVIETGDASGPNKKVARQNAASCLIERLLASDKAKEKDFLPTKGFSSAMHAARGSGAGSSTLPPYLEKFPR